MNFDTSAENLNLALTAFFFLEMLLSMLAYGFINYCKDSSNLFDALIVTVSIVEIILGYVISLGNTGLTVLRGFRLLRVLKLAKFLHSQPSAPTHTSQVMDVPPKDHHRRSEGSHLHLAPLPPPRHIHVHRRPVGDANVWRSLRQCRPGRRHHHQPLQLRQLLARQHRVRSFHHRVSGDPCHDAHLTLR